MQMVHDLEIRADLADGTQIILDLLNGSDGVYLDKWRPSRATYKSGGIFGGSPYSDGEQLIHAAYDLVDEQFSLKYHGDNQTAMVQTDQKIAQLMQLAAQSGIAEWSSCQVYLYVRPNGIDDPVYALIHSGRVEDGEEPFGTLWHQDGGTARETTTWDRMRLNVKRGHWTSSIPGSGTAVNISQSSTFEDRLYGNVDANGDLAPSGEAYISGRHVLANLTDVYNYTDSGATFSANLLDESYPVTLFPDTPAVDDAVYFGIDTSNTAYNLFNNIVFNVTTALSSTGGISITGEVYKSGAWGSLSSEEGSPPFLATGTNVLAFLQFTDFAGSNTTTVNGVTGYWIRYRVTAVSGDVTRPVLGTRPYYANKNYFEIQAADLGGDIRALTKIVLSEAQDVADATYNSTKSDRYYFGVRSIDRGENFHATLNPNNGQNATGINTSHDESDTTDQIAPLGRIAQGTFPITGQYVYEADWIFASSIANEYAGRFLVIGRAFYDRNGGTLASRVRLYQGDSENYVRYDTPTIIHDSDGDPTGLIVYGAMSIPSNIGSFSINWQFESTTSTSGAVVNMIDLTLLPIDELAFYVSDEFNHGEYPASGLAVKIDGLSGTAISTIITDSTGIDYASNELIAPTGIALPPNAKTRVFMLCGNDSDDYGGTAVLFKVSVTANKQYLGLRGD